MASKKNIISTLSIIVPVYNEERTILAILEKLKELSLVNDIQKEIILVNDCSTDNSDEIIQHFIHQNPKLDVHYFIQPKNKGKGAALHRGIQAATGQYLVIQDADLEYDPEDFNHMLLPILKGKADVVYGSRFKGANPHRILFFWHSLGNHLLTFLSNMMTNLNLTDMETCYKMFDTKILQSLDLKEPRFGFEPEVTQKIARVPKIRIYEVGISYYGRTYDEGKKIGWKDGVRAIFSILKYGFFK